MAKPRPDSVLKTLPEESQELLWTYLQQNSYADAVEWCADELDVETSASALQRFWDWFSLRLRFRRSQEGVETMKAEAERLGDMSTEDIERLGDAMFLMDSLQDKDAKVYMGMRNMQARMRALELDRDRFDFLERKYEEAKEARDTIERAASDDALTPEQFKQITEDALNIK